MKVRYIRFHPTDWLEGCISLSHEERSVYITVCACIYARGGPVEVDHVRKFCPGHGFKRAFDGLVRKGKVDPIRTENGLKVDQKRTATELRSARHRTEQAVTNGSKGGRPNGLAKPDGFQNRKTNQEPLTTKEDSESEADASAPGAAPPQTPPVDPVKVLWDSAVGLLEGAHVKNPRPLIGKWRREYGDVAVMAAVNQAEVNTVSNPVAFIVATLARNGGNGHGRQQELSPVSKLYLGASQVVDEIRRRESERKRREEDERNRRQNGYSFGALLDCK